MVLLYKIILITLIKVDYITSCALGKKIFIWSRKKGKNIYKNYNKLSHEGVGSTMHVVS